MDPNYWWWGHGFGAMWIFPLLALCLFFLLGLLPRTARSGEGAREILDRRYAKGEITREQYEEMKRALKA